MPSATTDIARWVADVDPFCIETETMERAKQAVFDCLGVAIAGSREPLLDILIADAIENGEQGRSTLLGRYEQVCPASAALVNGAAAHALDFDDVNQQMRGHPSAAVLPAVLTLAEQFEKSGSELLVAFIAGYQVACSVGEMMGPSHYEQGWHSTATVGTFGAAAGAARLLGLNARGCARALGIAGTQAAGLKAMFGTMCKPLHAGKAAVNGLLAARWASRGMTANEHLLEAHQGFAHTQSETFQALPLPRIGSDKLAVEASLYKYHAACFLTHASIAGVAAIVRTHSLTAEQITRIKLHIPAAHTDVCDIITPQTGLEIKFSIRHLAAMAATEMDTANLLTYSTANAIRPDLVALRNRVELINDDKRSRHSARVIIETSSGASYEAEHDMGVPLADTTEQWSRLESKFERISTPVLGVDKVHSIEEHVRELEALTSIATLTSILRPGGT